MWKCPKCQREFKNTNQNHFCEDKPQTIEAYITQQGIEIQPILNEVYDTLRTVLPDAQERMSWQMPTFWNKQNIIHFAAFKNHLGIYPGDKAVAHFAQDLKGYKTSKGAIQFPYNQPIPLELIATIARWCDEERKRD